MTRKDVRPRLTFPSCLLPRKPCYRIVNFFISIRDRRNLHVYTAQMPLHRLLVDFFIVFDIFGEEKRKDFGLSGNHARIQPVSR